MTVAIFATLLASVSPAPSRDYQVQYVARHDQYCVRPMTDAEAARLAIPLAVWECHSVSEWRATGLEIARDERGR